MGDVPTIAVINESTVAKHLDVCMMVNALHKQVWRDFVPAWGIKRAANIVFIPPHHAVPADAWQLVVMDNSDQAGALGYHDVTPAGLPLGKVFAKDDILDGCSVSVTISHELLEMLGDPNIQEIFQMQDASGQIVQYCYEACDACEDDSLGYKINGILLSDFVYPRWFSDPAQAKPGEQYDFQNKITAPLQLLAGGYIGKQIVINGVPQGWTQVTAKNAPVKPAHKIKVGSRRHRRANGVMKNPKLSKPVGSCVKHTA